MTVGELAELLSALPSEVQDADVYLAVDGELDVVRVVTVQPAGPDALDDDGPAVYLAGTLDGMASRFTPAEPAPPRACECDDKLAWERGDES